MHRISVVNTDNSNGYRLHELQLCRLWEHFLESRQTTQPAPGTMDIECDKVRKSEATDESVRARSLTLLTDLQPHATLDMELWMNYKVYILR